MLGWKERDQLELFITGSLRQLVPDDHVLARVDQVLDLSWLPGEVGDAYCTDNGRPSIDLRWLSGSCWPASCSASCVTAG